MKKGIILVLIAAAIVAGLVFVKHTRPEDTRETDVATDVPVHVGKITRATLRGYISTFGTVGPEPQGERPAASARITAAVPGVVTKVNCIEGQHVNKGDVLVQLDSRVADVAVDFAEKTAERQKKLLQADGASLKTLQEAQQQLDAAHAQQALLRVASPLSGTVIQVNAIPGQGVDLTSVLAEVMDLDRLVINASVQEAELAAVKIGQAAEVLTQNGATSIVGKVSFISPQMDEKTGAATVRLTLPAGSGLRPGQFVSVRIVSEEHPDCLAVPADSVVEDATGASVIDIVQNGKAVQTAVKEGLRDNGWVEVEGPSLQAGMTVVTKGAYGLPQDTKVSLLTN